MSDDKGNNIRSHHFTRDTLYQILAFLIKRSTCGSSEISPWHGQTSLGLDYFFSFFCRTICPSHRLLASWRTFILLFPLCFLIHNNTFYYTTGLSTNWVHWSQQRCCIHVICFTVCSISVSFILISFLWIKHHLPPQLGCIKRNTYISLFFSVLWDWILVAWRSVNTGVELSIGYQQWHGTLAMVWYPLEFPSLAVKCSLILWPSTCIARDLLFSLLAAVALHLSWLHSLNTTL